MIIYLINLARRPDRLAAMTIQADALGLRFTRIAALDAHDTRAADTAAIDRHFAATGPLGPLPRGDKACGLSHRLAWDAFLASGETHAVILEDDVVLAPAAAALLRDARWIGPEAELVKLEHFGPKGQRILVGKPQAAPDGFALAPLLSRHPGGAAYILSRKAAARLAAIDRFTLPVDHLLFNPNNSPVFAELRPLQLIPAIARQRGYSGEVSDIAAWRAPYRKVTPAYIKRELIRFGYDLKLIPRQLWAVLTGKARLVEITVKN